jgi:hypothetical protein
MLLNKENMPNKPKGMISIPLLRILGLSANVFKFLKSIKNQLVSKFMLGPSLPLSASAQIQSLVPYVLLVTMHISFAA